MSVALTVVSCHFSTVYSVVDYNCVYVYAECSRLRSQRANENIKAAELYVCFVCVCGVGVENRVLLFLDYTRLMNGVCKIYSSNASRSVLSFLVLERSLFSCLPRHQYISFLPAFLFYSVAIFSTLQFGGLPCTSFPQKIPPR